MLFQPEGLIPSPRRKAEFREGSPRRAALRRAAMRRPLVAEGVRKEFGGLVAVNDVDFTIPERSIVSLIGPNGAGKTTFFNMLTGVYKPTAGQIVFDGHDVTAKPPHAITQRGVGPHLPEHPPVPEHDRDREHARRACTAGSRAGSCVACSERRASSGRRQPLASGRTSCSSFPACAGARTITRGTSRTATSAGSRSPERSPPSRSSCSSTSRPPA